MPTTFLHRRCRRRGLQPAAVTGTAAVLAGLVGWAALGLAGCGASGSHSEGISVTATACAHGWHAPGSGTTTFEVANRTAGILDVQLRQAAGGQLVFAEIPTLGPHTTRPVTVTLAPGRYQWQCASPSGVVYESDAGKVTGPPVAATPGYVPVLQDDLSTAAYSYRASVTAGLATLAADTDKLQGLVDAGQISEAEGQWLVAHLDYERLGAAYDAFGDFDDEIDGRANGLPQGVADPGFTGFHRLEYALWHGQPPATLASVADQLDGFVHGLVKAFPDQVLLVTDLPLRAHEILENALQFELAGATDYGSGTNLATMAANVQGTLMTLGALRPLLQARNPQLTASLQQGLDHLSTLLDGYDTGGRWTPVEQLTTSERQVLDGTTGALLEQLSIVPDSLRLFNVGGD